MADDVRKLRRKLERQGWRIEQKKAGFMAYSPDRMTKVMIHLTPGDRRAMRNAIARLKKGGFDPDA
jgi:hypothetical protein